MLAPPAAGTRTRPRALANWLFCVAAMVVVMVVVGGITRLTESGLSITRWEVISGTLPPLSDADWAREFARYRETPQYRLQSGPAGMDLAAFQFIYFWEWFHRLLGRLIGLAFALPLLWFWWRGAIPTGYKPRLVALLLLGALQGVFGWYMVASGLTGTRTSVSHFWLSIHLMTALFTLAGLVWTALDLRRMASIGKAQPARWTWPATVAGAILGLQLLLGAWVAGLDAGHASDEWPLMQGRLVPEYDSTRGLLYAATHDPFLLHFLHRWWAFVVVIALVWFARRVRPLARGASVAIHSAFGVQVLLGIATVLSGVALWLAVGHQLVGALLVAAFAWGAHILGRTPA
ncbi:COX15/CtaA family protein [Qipengyuania sediminis]|uniref:COX15/CtaA family protein n=1 Tax=Qipengyuania sediminis TaxID=1532023 RepID=UPI001059BAA2|nr:COX15/CtaA family protein [Qipengyuania sediminis]